MPAELSANTREMVAALVACGVMALAVGWWHQQAGGLEPALQLAGGIALGAVVYGGCLTLAFPAVCARARRLLLGSRGR